jgi:hypothetical protein
VLSGIDRTGRDQRPRECRRFHGWPDDAQRHPFGRGWIAIWPQRPPRGVARREKRASLSKQWKVSVHMALPPTAR